MCQQHWDKLRAAIVACGLAAFVSGDGAEAALRLVDEKFDPLMNAGMAIFNNALESVGLNLMAPGDNGKPPCPICFLSVHCCRDPNCPQPCQHFEKWIEFAANDQLDEAKKRGLVSVS